MMAKTTPTQQQQQQREQKQKHDLAFIMNPERSAHVPSLPLELWNLIFFENTDPHHLWVVGRQVCATWRAEIPKVIAKKYLEDRHMMKIDSCCPWNMRSVACLMGRDLVFSHYKGKDRMVFARSVERDENDHSWECTEHIARMKEARSQNINDFHVNFPTSCLECTDKAGGKRCDLPTYYIQIKMEYLTTELPRLEVDFEKGEISVEWKAMLTAFYREAAVLKRHSDQLATKASSGSEKRSARSLVWCGGRQKIGRPRGTTEKRYVTTESRAGTAMIAARRTMAVATTRSITGGGARTRNFVCTANGTAHTTGCMRKTATNCRRGTTEKGWTVLVAYYSILVGIRNGTTQSTRKTKTESRR